MKKYTPGGITPEQDEQIRKRMYGDQCAPTQESTQEPAPQSAPPTAATPSSDMCHSTAPSDSALTVDNRWRFGLTLMLLSVWVMAMVGVLPVDSRRWLFFGFSVTMAAIAGWLLDRASHKRRDLRP